MIVSNFRYCAGEVEVCDDQTFSFGQNQVLIADQKKSRLGGWDCFWTRCAVYNNYFIERDVLLNVGESDGDIR